MGSLLKGGGVEIFRFADLVNFWFGFSVFALKRLQFFGFGVLCSLRVFSYLFFDFRFLATIMAVFQIFCQMLFMVFLVFSRKVHFVVSLERIFQGTTCKPSTKTLF